MEIGGYPADVEAMTGFMYQDIGMVQAVKKTEKGGFIIRYDVQSSGGNSGSPINIVDQAFVQNHRSYRQMVQFYEQRGFEHNLSKMTIGVHTAGTTNSKLGTLITPQI